MNISWVRLCHFYGAEALEALALAIPVSKCTSIQGSLCFLDLELIPIASLASPFVLEIPSPLAEGERVYLGLQFQRDAV